MIAVTTITGKTTPIYLGGLMVSQPCPEDNLYPLPVNFVVSAPDDGGGNDGVGNDEAGNGDDGVGNGSGGDQGVGNGGGNDGDEVNIGRDSDRDRRRPPETPTLSSPSNVRINNTIISWNAVNNATGYHIYVDGRVSSETIANTNFDLADLELSVGTHAIRVRAVYAGTRFNNSALSVAVNFVVEDVAEPIPTPPQDTTPTPWVNPFTDVHESDWFFDSVRFAHQNNLFSGTSDTTFSPNMPMTRGMMVTVLHRMAGSPASGSSVFTDVTDDRWYTNAVNWAASNGIVAGYGDGRFGPSDNINREQMAAILYRYAEVMGLELPSVRTGSFNDETQISGWALREEMPCMKRGFKRQRWLDLRPAGATRAEVATMLRYFMEATNTANNAI